MPGASGSEALGRLLRGARRPFHRLALALAQAFDLVTALLHRVLRPTARLLGRA